MANLANSSCKLNAIVSCGIRVDAGLKASEWGRMSENECEREKVEQTKKRG